MFMLIGNDFFIDKISKEMWICWKFCIGIPALACTECKNLTVPISGAFRRALLTSDSGPVGSDLEDFGHLTPIKRLDKSSNYK